MAKKHCEACGASVVEYKRAFSKDLARCVYRIAMAGGNCVDVSSLKLTHPQYSNFQRLRFWGLVQKEPNEDGSSKGGVWSLTAKGWAFARGNLDIPNYVWTYRGNPIGASETMINIRDISEGWWYRDRVVAESRPHEDVAC